MESAESSIELYDIAPDYGLDILGRYINENITSWSYQVNFADTYCVDKVLNLKGNIETHSWQCSTENGCVTDDCEGSRCEDIVISVINENTEETDLPANCGNAVKLSIPKANHGQMLHFDYYGISDVAVIGRLYDSRTEESNTEEAIAGEATPKESTTEESTNEDSSNEESATEESTNEDSSNGQSATEESTTEESGNLFVQQGWFRTRKALDNILRSCII